MSSSGGEAKAAPRARRGRRKKAGDPAAKLRKRIAAAEGSKNFYLAQQLYMSLYNRTKESDRPAALQALTDGAMALLKLGQGCEGGALATAFVEAKREGKDRPTKDDVAKIQQVFSLFPERSRKERVDFMNAAIGWTAALGECPHGDTKLHTDLARFLDAKRDYAEAHMHYVRGARPMDHARCLMAWVNKGYPSERGLFVVRAVLEYLCVQNLRDANTFFEACAKAFDEDEAKRPPEMNFSEFLLRTVERDAAPLFDMLKEKYKICLGRDPALSRYLDRIGHLYFGRPNPKGFLDEIMGMLQ